MNQNNTDSNALPLIKVLVADDHNLIIGSIVKIVEGFDMVSKVYEASSKDEVFKILGRAFIDVLVLDINMGGYNMLDYIEDIRNYHPKIKIIVLTGYSDQSILMEALSKRINAYLTKNTDPNEIYQAFVHVLNGKSYIRGSEIKNSLHNESFLLSQKLTSREQEVLQLIAKGYTNSKVAKELHLSIHTIKSHRKNLHKKLKINNVNELIAFAYNNNLVDPNN